MPLLEGGMKCLVSTKARITQHFTDDYRLNMKTTNKRNTNCEEFAEDTKKVKKKIKKFLKKWFGKRCDDYYEDCLCCQRWKLLDDLLANPFEEHCIIADERKLLDNLLAAQLEEDRKNDASVDDMPEVSKFSDEALHFATRCWQDATTKHLTMDPALLKMVTQVIAVWMDSYAQEVRNSQFYRDLLTKCGEAIGPAAYICDDGQSVSLDPLVIKIPELVKELCQNLVAHQNQSK